MSNFSVFTYFLESKHKPQLKPLKENEKMEDSGILAYTKGVILTLVNYLDIFLVENIVCERQYCLHVYMCLNAFDLGLLGLNILKKS